MCVKKIAFTLFGNQPETAKMFMPGQYGIIRVHWEDTVHWEDLIGKSPLMLCLEIDIVMACLEETSKFHVQL